MIKSIIVAKAANHVIGKNNQLPWHLPADMQRFRHITLGHYVLMGRKTFEGLPVPLLGRKLIVMSLNSQYRVADCFVASSLAAAIEFAEQAAETELFIAGGEAIYRLALPWTDKIYLTEVKTNIIGDTFFPMLNKEEWIESQRVSYGPDARHTYAYDFVELIRSR